MRIPAIVLAHSLLLLPALAAEEVHVISSDVSKERVLLLVEGELVAIGKWPLQVQLFETGELTGCNLAHSPIIDLKKVRIKANDNPELPFLLLCGDQMVTARRASAVSMAPVEQTPPGSQEWRLAREGDSVIVHWRESDVRQWAITFRRP
jgi:hypothetical protein